MHGCPKGMQANPTEGFQGGDDAGTETAHAHSHLRACACTHPHMHAHTYTYVHAYLCALMHTQTHNGSRIRTCTHPHMHASISKHTHAHMYVYAHRHPCTCANAHACTTRMYIFCKHTHIVINMGWGKKWDLKLMVKTSVKCQSVPVCLYNFGLFGQA